MSGIKGYVPASDVVQVQRAEPDQERFHRQVEYGSLLNKKTDPANLLQPEEAAVLLAAGGQGFGDQDWSDFCASKGLRRDSNV